VTRPLRGDVLLRRHILAWHRDTFVAGRQAELVSAVAEHYWAEAKKAPVYAKYLESHP